MEKKPLLEALSHLRKRDWEAAHVIVQDSEAPLASWAHGIVHLIEGDESNARYWYRAAKREFPGMKSIDVEIEALQATLGPAD